MNQSIFEVGDEARVRLSATFGRCSSHQLPTKVTRVVEVEEVSSWKKCCESKVSKKQFKKSMGEVCDSIRVPWRSGSNLKVHDCFDCKIGTTFDLWD
jgi:hypothetical protein